MGIYKLWRHISEVGNYIIVNRAYVCRNSCFYLECPRQVTDKLVMFGIFGFIYTLNRDTEKNSSTGYVRNMVNANHDWTSHDIVIVNPIDILEIQETHTHRSDQPHIGILKGYNEMKVLRVARASQNSEESPRSIFASGVATMETSILVHCKYKNAPESWANPAFVSELQTLDK